MSVNFGQEEDGRNCDRLYSNCGDNCNCGNVQRKKNELVDWISKMMQENCFRFSSWISKEN